jgi:hypothetical protein
MAKDAGAGKDIGTASRPWRVVPVVPGDIGGTGPRVASGVRRRALGFGNGYPP